MKNPLRLLLLALIIFCGSFSVSAITVYISPTGNDITGNGTAGNPYKTFTKAFQVAGSPGDTVRLLAGTWWLTAPVNVPAGVHVIGETSGISRLRTTDQLDHRAGSATGNDFPWAVLRLEGGTNTTTQVISRIHIDGKTKIGSDSIKSAWVGILVKERQHVEVSYVNVRNCYFSGILLWGANDGEVLHSTLTNTAWGSTGWHSGSITIGNVKNTLIDDLTVSEGVSGVSNWGYGMKAYYSNPAPLENVTVRNSTFTCNPLGFFVSSNGVTLPNIGFEWHQAKAINCELSNNTFYNNLSLVNTYSPNGAGQNSVRINGNRFLKQAGDNGYYAIELTENNTEIDYNFFNGGHYPIAHWPLSGSSAASSGWDINHNVFTNIDAQTEGIIRLQNGLDSSKFDNNTFNITASPFDCVFKIDNSLAVISHIEVRNNIFTRTSGSTAAFQVSNGASLSNVNLTYNALINVTVGSGSVTASNNITPTSAQFIGSGSQPDPYFALQATSPCINQGIDVGSAYNGCKPDIGAFESEVLCPTGDVTIAFDTQPSGFGDIDNNQYNDVAGADVTFGTGFKYYDQTVNGWMGGPDHSATSDNKMAVIQGSSVSITFDEAVQVPSLWMSTLVYGSAPGVATGKLAGVTQWTRSVVVYNTWYEIVDGLNKDIDEIVFTNANSFAIDDLKVVNDGGGGRKAAPAAEESTLVGEEITDASLVYPNPVYSGETLKVNGTNIHRATLFDTSGRAMIREDAGDDVMELPTSGLRGLYLLRIEGTEGMKTVKVLVK